jgi:hypothetical protein
MPVDGACAIPLSFRCCLDVVQAWFMGATANVEATATSSARNGAFA